ncbi:MAG: DUF1289 domain-containing protein [Pseudomonadota bacterium]
MSLETPCIKVCVMDPTSGLCRGCGRTLAEIGAWTTLPAEARRAVMAALPARLAAAGLAVPPDDSANA